MALEVLRMAANAFWVIKELAAKDVFLIYTVVDAVSRSRHSRLDLKALQESLRVISIVSGFSQKWSCESFYTCGLMLIGSKDL